MKINISLDATAEEMREFLGLPNIRPLQEDMLQAIRQNMQQGTAGFDPLTLMKPLFPAQMQSMEMLQKAFWDAFKQPEPDKKSSKTENKRNN